MALPDKGKEKDKAAQPNPLATNPLLTIDIRWQKTTKSLNPAPKPTGTFADVKPVTGTERERIDRNTLVPVYLALKQAKLMHTLLQWFINSMFDNRHMIIDDIGGLLIAWEKDRDPDQAIFILKRLTRWKNEWYRETGAFIHHGVDAFWPFKRTFRTILLSYLPPSLFTCLRSAIYTTFHNPVYATEEVRSGLASDLDNMGILSDFKTLISEAMEKEIKTHIRQTCPGVRDRCMLPELKEWFASNVKAWLADIYGKERPDSAWRKFEQFMLKELCELRISELFEIIVDYEDKTHPLPVLQDLKECLVRTGQRKELVRGLRKQTIKRLLQPGAATSDILQQYVSTIKVLRYLDPPGVLLYGVAEPIRRYLRDRSDTIKIIVTNLVPRRKKVKLSRADKSSTGADDVEMTNADDEDDEEDEEDKDGFLLDEAADPTPIQANDEAFEDYSDPNWLPAAIDAEPSFRVQKASDIVSTLVSIFGSKDLFIKELQIVLGQRLLAISDGNYDEEIHNLEVLKVRFGDASLQVCDVMMKDLMDSRRIDQLIHSSADESTPMHTTILSRLFWPPMARMNLNMPGQFQDLQKQYLVDYEKQKPDKKLRIVPNVGTVDITVEMDSGEKLSMTVTPLQAAIIELFSQQHRWSAEELAEKLGGPDGTAVSLALMYWQMAGVIEAVMIESGSPSLEEGTPARKAQTVFDLRESLGEKNSLMGPHEDHEIELGEDDDADDGVEPEVFLNSVRAMIKNIHPMSTEEIHSRFGAVFPDVLSLEDSRRLLDSFAQQGQLDYLGGLWNLV